ncbi:MAG: DMT family transporter [Anaerolineae bacterium]|nr:DMT family transporter [Anaerolineae bacterium]
MSGEAIAILSALLWAVASVLLTVGAKRIPVVPMNMIRCTISTAFFWILLPFYGGLEALAAIPPLALVWMVVSVLGLLVIGDTLYFRSMDLAGVSWAMPLASINPLWAVLLASVFVDEPLTWSLLLGALLVVAGVTLLSRSVGVATGGRTIEPSERRTGLLLALITSVLWAVGQVALKPATAGMHSVVANSVRQPMGLLMLVGLTTVQGRWRDLRRLDRRSWAIIILASLVGTGLGTLFFIMAIQMAGAGRTAVLTSSAPLMAMPFSMLWLRERPTRWTVTGTLLTTAGIALVV